MSNALQRMLSLATRKNRPAILDGAIGTELDRRGASSAGPAWTALASLDDQRLLSEIHRDYLLAGAELLTANTFRTSRRAFLAAGLPEGLWREAARAAVGIAREVADGEVPVAGSIAPLEDCWRPDLAPPDGEAFAAHSATAAELVAAGIDLLWIETFGTIGEAVAASRAAASAGEPRGVPFAVSLTTRADGRLLSGESLERAAAMLSSVGARAASINCVPPWYVDCALEKLSSAVELPIGVWANLGRAEEGQDWSEEAYVSPEAYADLAVGWHADGARMIGACCGSTPEHIAALSRRFS